MKRNICTVLRILPTLLLLLAFTAGLVRAQSETASTNPSDPKSTTEAKKTEDKKAGKAKKTDAEPTSQTVGDQAGSYTIVGSIEFGYRGQRVDGDVNKFKSDLNYKAGPRLFDSSFLMKSKDGKGGLFDTFLVTSTGWGADPYGNMRVDVENPRWYRFEGTYRRFKYYRFLNNIANPNWNFSPIATPANPVTGLHGYDTYTQMGDFDLTILPKNEKIRFNVGYSPERYRGPAYTDYHNGGNEFWLLSNLRSRADDFRFGADGKVGKIDWTFLQGFRRFRDDSTIDQGVGLNRNVATSVAQLTSFFRAEPTRGSVDFTRASIHTFLAKRFDLTGRVIYSRSTSNSLYTENFTGTNFNFRITGWPPTPPNAQPNTTNPSFYNIGGNTKRPYWLGDVGMTFLATDKLRISDTFKVEDFTIDGIGTFGDFFSITRPITGGSRTDTFSVSDRNEFLTTQYRKYQNVLEGDYQISRYYSFHFGYRYGHRRDQRDVIGYSINANNPALLVPPSACTSVVGSGCEVHDLETNTTHAFFGGFKARPKKNWTIYFDAEHGTADNVFTRIGNYDYTNFRGKTRWTPNRKVNFNLAIIVRNNANPSELGNVATEDFNVRTKARTFQTSVDWMPNGNFSVSTGYNYNWLNSDSVIDYWVSIPTSTFHHLGHALYFMRNNFFFTDVTMRINRRMTLFTSYRINQDGGQGSQLPNITGGVLINDSVFNPANGSLVKPYVLGGTLINSYPMNFQSTDNRLAIRLNRHLDWNLGYQYYAYNENDIVNIFPPSPRPQNYHAHLPYMSLRFYIGRKE